MAKRWFRRVQRTVSRVLPPMLSRLVTLGVFLLVPTLLLGGATALAVWIGGRAVGVPAFTA